MTPFTKLTAIAAPIDEANVDTNQLCPTRFNKVPRGPGHAKILFHDRRFNADGSEKEHLLNAEPFSRARIIVADRNWGCGSSRESAVYALYEFGIRCVIAPSFGDIFFANCFQNGLLPVRLPIAAIRRIAEETEAAPGNARTTVDLERQVVVTPRGEEIPFAVDARKRQALLEGLDDIALTLRQREAIEAWRARDSAARPWAWESVA